jgi:hypothetical protein
MYTVQKAAGPAGYRMNEKCMAKPTEGKSIPPYKKKFT